MIDPNLSGAAGTPTVSNRAPSYTPNGGVMNIPTGGTVAGIARMPGQSEEDYARYVNHITQGSGLSYYSSPATSSSDPSQPAPQQQQSGIDVIGNGPGSAGYNQAANNFMNSPTAGDSMSAGGGGGGGAVQLSGGANSGSNLSGLLSGLSGANGNQGNNPNFTFPDLTNLGGMSYQSPQSGISGMPGGGSLQMQPASAQDSMNSYMNTPGYQMLFGNQAAQNFQADPGYQYQVQQALLGVQQNAASQGLLQSGRVMRDMTSTASNLANQQYGNWWNRQNQMYSDYQNRLAGLAGGNTGGDMANQLGTNLASNNSQTGSNVASLFGNQGSTGVGAILNTGAAQAGALGNAANTQAQINAANQATRLAGASLAAGQHQNSGLF